jgi:hypothetical protein
MSNFPYAFAATVYFAIVSVALLVLGGQGIRSIVMMSLFLGAISQFAIQGRGPFAELHSNMVAYVAMALLLIAIVLYMFK